MYSVCSQALIDQPRAWHFEELLDLVVKADLGTRQELKPKLYANMQVWASQKKIARGAERQTFQASTTAAKAVITQPLPSLSKAEVALINKGKEIIKKVVKDVSAQPVPVKPVSNSNKPQKLPAPSVLDTSDDSPKVIGQVAAKKPKKGEVDVNAVVKGLYDILGQAINRNRNNAWAIQFDSPDYTPAWAMERYKAVFGGKLPTAWAYEINITFGYVTVWLYA